MRNQRSETDARVYKIKTQGALTPTKAQILGFLAGDGCIAERRGRGINTDPALLEWFKRAVIEVYGVEPSSTTQSKGRIKPLTDLFLCKAITEDLHSLATWGIHGWCVPTAVLQSGDRERASYVRGFFDAEGTVFASVGRGSPRKHHNTVSATSANEAGLLQVRDLLEGLGISTGFYPVPLNGKVYYKVQVHRRSSVILFADLVGFVSPLKRETLNVVRSFPPVLKKGDVYTSRLARIKELGLESAPAPVVARELGCSLKQVWDARRW